jgi:hypothetical protein
VSKQRDLLYLKLNPYATLNGEIYKDTRDNKLYKVYLIRSESKVHCMTWPFPTKSIFVSDCSFYSDFELVSKEEAEQYKTCLEEEIKNGREHYLSV